MSAWIVSKTHIDALVTAGVDRALDYPGPFDRGLPIANMTDTAGMDLWRENYISVNHRYDRSDTVPQYHLGEPVRLPAIWLQKLIHCYEYQSCEHPGWEQSHAFAYCSLLARTLGDEFVQTHTEAEFEAEYERAPWGIGDDGYHDPRNHAWTTWEEHARLRRETAA
jgi:hypothetical protein